MKKNILYAALFLSILLLAFLLAKSYLTENAWICVDGRWEKQGSPAGPAPEIGCGSEEIGAKTPDTVTDDLAFSDRIKVSSPAADATISSPLEIKGEAKGSWFFEGSFPMRIEDSNGTVLVQAPVQALGDWMTEDFVPFSVIVSFVADTATGTLVLQNDNPSGLPENSEEVRIPVKFDNSNLMTVKAYFSNSKFDPGAEDCSKVYAVARQVSKSAAVGNAAMQELLQGPTESEKADGYFTSINPEVSFKKLIIEDGVAKIVFDQQLNEGAAGACRVTAIRAQIEETLKQFPTVKSVEISIDGMTDEILQP